MKHSKPSYCFYCNEIVSFRIPKLECSHNIHPDCYCKLKNINPYHGCLICDKEMKRRQIVDK